MPNRNLSLKSKYKSRPHSNNPDEPKQVKDLSWKTKKLTCFLCKDKFLPTRKNQKFCSRNCVRASISSPRNGRPLRMGR